MRVIVICGAGYISGKEKIMFSMLAGFAAAGDEVHCITSSWGNGQFEALLKSGNISYSKMRLGFISKTLDSAAIKMTLIQLLYLPALLYRYKKLIRTFKPDVVIHSNFHHTFLLYPVISASIVNVYHSHESIANTKFYRKLFLHFQKKINLFVGVSAYVTNKLSNLGIHLEKLKTIHNGLAIRTWEPNAWQQPLVFKIGIIGQVGAWKGHEDLLLALALLQTEEPQLKWKLFIYGDGQPAYISEMQALIKQRQLNGLVEWKGFVKDIKDIYQDLQLVCVPSRSEEPFATSALEAGLFAVPVIVTRRGGFLEIVEHGYNGFIVEANEPEQIKNWLSILIKDPARAYEAGINHRQRVHDSFSIQKFIGNWRSTLSELVA